MYLNCQVWEHLKNLAPSKILVRYGTGCLSWSAMTSACLLQYFENLNSRQGLIFKENVLIQKNHKKKELFSHTKEKVECWRVKTFCANFLIYPSFNYGFAACALNWLCQLVSISPNSDKQLFCTQVRNCRFSVIPA